MAKELLHPKVEISTDQTTGNLVNLTAWCDSVDMPQQVDALESTSFNDDNRTYIPGMEGLQVTLQFQQDFAAAAVWATLNAIKGEIVLIHITAKRTEAISATNPQYQFLGFWTTNNPLQGGVSELARASVTFQISGAITIDTTP